MYQLEVPKVLKRGDTIALISISGGRAGDKDMLYRYQIGKERLEELWGVRVITTPNALAGSNFLYEHPEARAADLMWAMQNKEVNGIICMMGGDDSRREDIPVLSNVDFVHRMPMTVIPIGVVAEIDCRNVTFRIMESGVAKA